MATIGGARGILVVGGATGEDLVEFMDWDDQTQWTTLGKLNRGRGRKRHIEIIDIQRNRRKISKRILV